MGCTSFSCKLVLKSRTPQLMSKPTPPGDTIDFGFDISNAAILPIKQLQIMVMKKCNKLTNYCTFIMYLL